MPIFHRDHDRQKPGVASDISSNLGRSGGASIEPRSPSPGCKLSSDALPSDTGTAKNDVTLRPSPVTKNRFTSPWAQKRPSSDDENGTKSRGPLGLHLLHSSPEPLIDLIFVHGLRGGSVKTWQKGKDPRFFWPQFWLPVEPEFNNVNIHSFGYDADWASSKASILNVHDFGQSLLEEMRNSPSLINNSSAPIVLLGHSMGGLVIKKAFVLSKEVSEFQDRIRCIFFLATPHRGSNYAAMFNNILTVSGVMSSQPYISDLTTGSTSAQRINDDFLKYANDLTIFSFYETLPMNIRISSRIIVEKNSAILGCSNERVQYLNADHKDICKFDSREDPNYVTLKNALAGALQILLQDVSMTEKEKTAEQMELLKPYLGISDLPDEQYHKVEGSCRWIDSRGDFQEWRDSAAGSITAEKEEAETNKNNPSIYWVRANPGTGKTYLASHVIAELQNSLLECAYHYFHVGNENSRSVGGCLRSIAYQMAISNAAVREKLSRLRDDGSTFDKDDSLTIWNIIFKEHLPVDALDECFKYQEFFSMLKGANPSFPLRIFITSREVSDFQRLYRPLEASASLTCIEIPEKDSISDIECYIESRIENLPIDTIADKKELKIKVLRRSNASFLWVRLVLDELEQVYSKESILQVLEGIPEGMVPYYERTTRTMAENKLEKHIAKAVLVWVVAACRKMTISELSNALKLDINTILPSAKSAVTGLCGQLVSIDRVSDAVDVIHPTAREFLLSPDAGEFTVSKPKAHERIALTCLQLLSSNELQPPNSRRFPLPQQRQDEPSPFLDYALTQFSEHINSALAETDELLLALDRFFRTTALPWIDRVARKGDLHCLIRTSKNLKAYVDRRVKHHSPLSGQIKNIYGWSVDLSRLVAKFGAALLENPSSIYCLIPPLCPSLSTIYQQFRRMPDGLTVVGFKSETWDDCVASVSFGDDVAVAVSCGENLIAVGMESNDIGLYNQRSCQKECVLHLKHPVDLVHFADSFIAACTTRTITLQDLNGNTIWETRLRFRCILLTSSADTIIAVSQHGHILAWDMKSGELLDDQTIAYRHFDSDTEQNVPAARAPSLASISPDMETLALGYRGGAVCLWDLGSGNLVGWARDEEDRLAAKLLFNPNPDANLLLVIYTNHDLSIYDTWSGSLVSTHKTSNDVGLLSASCSPDGRTLATTDMQGNMQIWDFSSLSLLYHVLSPFPSFRILNFTSDGSSIVDVMDSGMRIWSPAALVRKNFEEDNSVSDDAPNLPVIEGQYESLRTSRITALYSHPSLPAVFAGKYNGEVLAFNTRTGQRTSVLYSHSSASFITELAVSKGNIIASSDVSGALLVWKLVPGPSSSLKRGSLLLRRPPTTQIRQLCFSANGNFLLVATTLSDHVYNMKDGSYIGSLHFEVHERGIWRWLSVPEQEPTEQFSLINDRTLRRYDAQKFPNQSESSDIFLDYRLPEDSKGTNIDMAVMHPGSRTLVLEMRYDLGNASCSISFLFNLSLATSESNIKTLSASHDVFSSYCKHFMGFSHQAPHFVFLHRNSWLSSCGLEDFAQNRHSQHFFVPDEYISTSHEVLPVKTAEDDFVFCLHGELAIVKNGRKFQDVKVLK
ncbi:NACHT and WD domain protein [Ilyonectria sp. MPI-CAGE-AT-0026]|nr:NACHT and WD domain protein [Ilyonectria sp. MPI-CAGE-AT-0026]